MSKKRISKVAPKTARSEVSGSKTSFSKALGQRVQQVRRLRGLSQEELAEKINRSSDMVSDFERGLNSTRIETLVTIAKALDMSMSELFEFMPPVADKDREQRKLLDSLMQLLQPYDEATIRTIIQMTKTLLPLQGKKKVKRN